MNPGLHFALLTAMSRTMEYLLFSGAILVVAGIIALWAAIVRKPRGTRRYRYRRPSRAEPPPVSKKSKRRRRSEPPRNPTLAETRGLPPVRKPGGASSEPYQN